MCVEGTSPTILISLIFEGHLENRILALLKKKQHKVLCMIKPLAIGFHPNRSCAWDCLE
jgi:hypothetical protein